MSRAEVFLICALGFGLGATVSHQLVDPPPVVWELEKTAAFRLAPKYRTGDEHVDYAINRTPDGKPARWSPRVDLLSGTHAIEIDWHDHWAEAIGQSLFYAIKTHRKPGIILLAKGEPTEAAHLEYCKTVGEVYNIDIWVEKAEPRAD